MPAFKPGEKVTISGTQLKADAWQTCAEFLDVRDIAPLLMYMEGPFAWKSYPVQKKKSWNFLIMGRSKAKYMYMKF